MGNKYHFKILNKNRTDVLSELWYLDNLKQLPVSCHQIAKKTKLVSAQIAKILKEFEDRGFIKKKKSGREVFIELTTRGEKVSQYICLIINEVESGK